MVPQLLKTFTDPDEVSNRGATLGHVANLVLSARDDIPAEEATPPALLQHKDEVLGGFVSGLAVTTSAAQALKGLDGLVTTKALITDEELGYIVHNVNELLQTDSDEEAR